MFSFRFSVSLLISTNTGVAPRSTKAFAVETNVYDGIITSSSGPTSASIADISNAAVHEWVKSALSQPRLDSSQLWHFCVNKPSPANWESW